MDESIEAKSTYYAALPTKRVGAGLVCRDASGRVLLVRPTYKPGWEIPGGVVEADESPAAAVAREVREELGVALSMARRLEAALAALDADATRYLEAGEEISAPAGPLC